MAPQKEMHRNVIFSADCGSNTAGIVSNPCHIPPVWPASLTCTGAWGGAACSRICSSHFRTLMLWPNRSMACICPFQTSVWGILSKIWPLLAPISISLKPSDTLELAHRGEKKERLFPLTCHTFMYPAVSARVLHGNFARTECDTQTSH